MKFITLFSLAFILLALNLLFRQAIKRISIRNIILDYFKRYIPVIELICWSTFTIWLLNRLFSTSPYATYLNYLVIILVVVFVSWFFLRDFIAGVQVKSRFNLVKGQKFLYGELKAEIKDLGLLVLKIKDKHGSDMMLPYAKIDQKNIKFNILDDGERESRFIIELDKNLDEQETTDKLKELIINSAWSSHKSLPLVQVIGEQNGIKQYEITFQPMGTDGPKKLKSMLVQTLAS